MRFLLLGLLALVFVLDGSAQRWIPLKSTAPAGPGIVLQHDPVNWAARLASAPPEQSASGAAPVLDVQLPRPAGSATKPATFRLTAYDMGAGPDFPTLYGYDLADPRRTVFLNWSARGGLHATIRAPDGSMSYLDPAGSKPGTTYRLYRAAEVAKSATPFRCWTDDRTALASPSPPATAPRKQRTESAEERRC